MIRNYADTIFLNSGAFNTFENCDPRRRAMGKITENGQPWLDI